MLNLENILWVIPGLVFIFQYNHRVRPVGSINLTGWPYVFFLVFIAAITWLPAEWVVNKYCQTDSLLLTFFLSIFFSYIWMFIARVTSIDVLSLKTRHDNFCLKCVDWEENLVFLTLKNDNAYVGILWKYPETPTSRYELQTISIAPLMSGFRLDDKTIKWNIYYPYENQEDMEDMETIIPRPEIITFGKFNRKIHDHFTGQNSAADK